MDNIYAENILDHYSNPRNFGKPNSFDITSQEFNPLCGDEVNIYLTIKNNKIEDIKFIGGGCAISQAAASILSEHILGKDMEEVKKYDKEDIINLLGIPIGIVRIKCALLSLKAIQSALNKYPK